METNKWYRIKETCPNVNALQVGDEFLVDDHGFLHVRRHYCYLPDKCSKFVDAVGIQFFEECQE